MFEQEYFCLYWLCLWNGYQIVASDWVFEMLILVLNLNKN